MTRMIGALLIALLVASPAWAGKISDRTSATTPLTGAETIGVIQGGADRKITLNDIGVAVSGIYYPENYGDTTGSDSQVAIQAAIDAASAARGGTVQLRSKSYTTNAAINPKSNVILQGVPSSTYQSSGTKGTNITNSASDMFALTGNVSGWGMRDLRLSSTNGHQFNTSTHNFVQSKFTNVWFLQNSTDKSIFTMTNTAGKYVGQLRFEDINIQFADGNTVPAMFFNQETINTIYFDNVIVQAIGQASASTYAFQFISGGAAIYAENIQFNNMLFEITRGGMIDLASVRDVVLTNISLYDLTAVPDNPLVQIRKDAGSVASIGVTFINPLIFRNHATVPDVYVDGTVSGQGRVVFVGGKLGRVKGSSTASAAGKFLSLHTNVSNWEVATRTDLGAGQMATFVGAGLGPTIMSDAAVDRGGLNTNAAGTGGVLRMYDATAGNMKYCVVASGTMDCSATSAP